MTKKILVVYYTQTGQLEQIINRFLEPFSGADIKIDRVQAVPTKEFDFPWSGPRFFDAMPESVLGIPAQLNPLHFTEPFYDLVIFGWQPWFLSPSIPSTSILNHPSFRAIIKNTPVITITGARNMWLNAMERIKQELKTAGAQLVGNIVLTDRNQNFISGVTILYWMFAGKKDKFLGLFPKPGVSDADIASAELFGETTLKHLYNGQWDSLQTELVEEKAVPVKWDLMFIEARAGKLFSIWANLIIKKKNRARWLVLFKYYLLIALFIVAPVVVGIYGLLLRPFLQNAINRKKKYYRGLELT